MAIEASVSLTAEMPPTCRYQMYQHHTLKLRLRLCVKHSPSRAHNNCDTNHRNLSKLSPRMIVVLVYTGTYFGKLDKYRRAMT